MAQPLTEQARELLSKLKTMSIETQKEEFLAAALQAARPIVGEDLEKGARELVAEHNRAWNDIIAYPSHLADRIAAFARAAADERDSLYGCEFCDVPISEREGKVNVCGRCYNKAVDQLQAAAEAARRDERNRIVKLALAKADEYHESAQRWGECEKRDVLEIAKAVSIQSRDECFYKNVAMTLFAAAITTDQG